MHLRPPIACLLAALFAGAGAAQDFSPLLPARWTTDMAEAQKQAEADRKDLLLFFTGSDWCPWCQKLKAEVFDAGAFAQDAPRAYVLVEFDFPQTKAQTDAVKTQNVAWMRKCGLAGFPVVLLADAKGRPYAQLGYEPGGAENYLKIMAAMRARRAARDAKWAQAVQTTDPLEKMRLLAQGLAALQNEELVLRHYQDIAAEIIRLDADGSAGAKGVFEQMKKRVLAANAWEKGMKELGPKAKANPKAALKRLEQLAATADLAPDLKQRTFLAAAQLCQVEFKDNAQTDHYLEQAIQAAPESQTSAKLRELKKK